MEAGQLRKIVEGALLAAGRPLPLDQIENLFDADDCPHRTEIEAALVDLDEDRSVSPDSIRGADVGSVTFSACAWLRSDPLGSAVD